MSMLKYYLESGSGTRLKRKKEVLNYGNGKMETRKGVDPLATI